MKVYVNGRLVVVETNVAWALPYWRKRKALNNKITWRVK